MANFLLIHGSGHGAWCWRDVLPLLSDAGHDARAIDLPGSGDDTTPPEDVTLELSVARIKEALEAFEGPVHLIGHSLGGMSITQTAEAMPDKIALLIYLCAWVPIDGQAARDLRAAAGCKGLVDATRFSADGQTMFIADHLVDDLFYHDCPPETVSYARARLRPQPLGLSTAPVHLSDRARAVPRHYIVCKKDRAIPAEAQRGMVEGWRPGTVHTLACGHSPFFAAPDDLADLLSDIAGPDDTEETGFAVL